MRAVQDDPSLELVVDVVDRRIAVPAIELDEPFDLDDHSHHRLMHGLDDIGITETHAGEIGTFETGRPSWMPQATR
jgi:3-isopropylmalate/(R)-2-methylmalate dehydratase small subunit